MTSPDAAARLAELRERYLEAQLRGDRRAALSLVLSEGLERGFSELDLREGVIGAAQRRIGELWQSNAIGIAEEHMATAVSNLVLAQLYERSQQAPRNQRTVLVACVEGELHELPARLVADALDSAGFDVRFLGANVPVEHLMATLERAPEVDLLALSATMSFHTESLRATVRRVRALRPELPIAVGGAICRWSPGLTEELGVHVTADSGGELVARARSILGIAP